jgi:hypothetical protein
MGVPQSCLNMLSFLLRLCFRSSQAYVAMELVIGVFVVWRLMAGLAR